MRCWWHIVVAVAAAAGVAAIGISSTCTGAVAVIIIIVVVGRGTWRWWQQRFAISRTSTVGIEVFAGCAGRRHRGGHAS